MSPNFNSDSRWAHMRAPTAGDLSLLARKVWDAVPVALRDLTGEIAIIVEEFPDDETLDETGAETPFDIMGLLRRADDDQPLLVMTSGAHRVDTVALAELLGVASIEPATVVQVRTKVCDGYTAVQLGFDVLLRIELHRIRCQDFAQHSEDRGEVLHWSSLSNEVPKSSLCAA